MPGKLKCNPRGLEALYKVTYHCVKKANRLFSLMGYDRADRWLRPLERWSKKPLFDCRMCGQCILHSTGMVCPMTCPKQLRNGACGGVRSNGHCEVKPEMRCVWVEAYERANELQHFGPEIIDIKPPVNRQLEHSSAWINMLTGTDKDLPTGWSDMPNIPVVERKL